MQAPRLRSSNPSASLFPDLPVPGHDATAMTRAEAKSDKGVDLFAVRSVLFLPASNPRAIATARDSAADMVVLDLEDAVKPADKAAARNAALEAVAEKWPM